MSQPATERATLWSRIDRNWPLVIILVIGGGIGGGYGVATITCDGPILVGRLDPATRAILYGTISTSAGALVGLVIASIAILATLDPDRPRVRDMQSLRAWRILHVTFLVGAAFCAITLALTTIVLGIDSHAQPNEALEVAVVAIASVAFAELVVAGLAFALVVLKVASSTS